MGFKDGSEKTREEEKESRKWTQERGEKGREDVLWLGERWGRYQGWGRRKGRQVKRQKGQIGSRSIKMFKLITVDKNKLQKMAASKEIIMLREVIFYNFKEMHTQY